MAKILLADDSTHAQRMGAKILTAEGHEVSTVSNGQAAIKSLEQNAPELVIADVFMPGRSGYEVCHFVKTADNLKNIPVLLIIGAMEPYDPDEGKRAGADAVITKPLESSSLVTMVKDLLAASKRFAPTRAKAKETTSTSAPVVEAPSYAAAEEETPQWGDEPEVLLTPPPPEKLEIPHEMGQQAIGMLTDYMDAPAEVETSPANTMGSVDAMAMPAVEMSTTVETVAPAAQITQPEELVSGSSSAPQLDIAEKTTWSAEQAEMTAEEAKLFEQATANWGDLEQLVGQSDAGQNLVGQNNAAAAPPQPASDATPPPLPWQMPETHAAQSHEIMERDPGLEVREVEEAPIQPDAMLIVPEHIDAPTASDPGIEHYESLDAVVEAQGPVAYKSDPPPPPPTEEPAPEMNSSPEFSGPIEEIEAAPSERNLPPVEQLVRQAIEDLLPEIIARVKQSLKS